MGKSIIQEKTEPWERECFLCREEAEAEGFHGCLPNYGLDKHHFIHGFSRRKAEHYGLWAYVCRERHHIYGPEAPHSNHEVDLHLQQVAQTRFEEIYGHELWMKEFGKNYL